jgi:hypothetical protein
MEQQRISNRVYILHSSSTAYSFRYLSIATVTEPERICGVARRIGYTGKDIQALPMYRLKVTEEGGSDLLTLPPFFVLEKGVFVEYEQWCRTPRTTSAERELNSK